MHATKGPRGASNADDSTPTVLKKDCMAYCRFRGPFTPEERKLVEQAVAAVEDADGSELPSAPKWLVMRVSPEEHAVYVGVRFRDGQVVRA